MSGKEKESKKQSPLFGLDFWRRDTKQITIINYEDFPKGKILDWLGINNGMFTAGFGNCEAGEARERLAIMKFLHENKEFPVVEMFDDLAKQASIPSNDESFKRFYNPTGRSDFWLALERLGAFLKSKGRENLPSRLQTFYDVIIGQGELEKSENEMAERVLESMNKAATVHGFVKVRIYTDKGVRRDKPSLVKASMDLESATVYGHSLFSFHTLYEKDKEYPKWIRNGGLLNFLFGWNIGRKIKEEVDQYNREKKERVYKEMVIREVEPFNIDIEKAVKKIVLKNDKFLDFLDGADQTVVFNVLFTYGVLNCENKRKGLTLSILGFESPNDSCIKKTEVFHFPELEKITGEEEIFEEGREAVLKQVNEFNNLLNTAELNNNFKKVCLEKNFESFKHISVCSRNVDARYKWKGLNSLFMMSQNRSTFEKVSAFYFDIKRLCEQMKSMGVILKGISDKGEEIGANICFPQIVDDRSVVEFTNLYPLHLGLSDKKDGKIVPIDGKVSLSGSILGLTGRHGGGKTVIEHTLTGNIYLALSGLPVFGERFCLNAKTHLGLVFVEGVEGRSVFQEIGKKTKNIFEAIEGVDGRNVVLVLDEVGSNTQESEGLALGKRILESFNERKVGLVFSTQITDLAEYCQSNLDAKLFFVDKDHKINEGISGGEATEVIQEIGLAKYLK